jgi:hypothetical protein
MNRQCVEVISRILLVSHYAVLLGCFIGAELKTPAQKTAPGLQIKKS